MATAKKLFPIFAECPHDQWFGRSGAARGVQNALLPPGSRPTEDDSGEVRINCTVCLADRTHTMYSGTGGRFWLRLAHGLESLLIRILAARSRRMSEVREELRILYEVRAYLPEPVGEFD